MKSKYLAPKMEVIEFNDEDVFVNCYVSGDTDDNVDYAE